MEIEKSQILIWRKGVIERRTHAWKFLDLKKISVKTLIKVLVHFMKKKQKEKEKNFIMHLHALWLELVMTEQISFFDRVKFFESLSFDNQSVYIFELRNANGLCIIRIDVLFICMACCEASNSSEDVCESEIVWSLFSFVIFQKQNFEESLLHLSPFSKAKPTDRNKGASLFC